MTEFASFIETYPYLIVLLAIWSVIWKGIALWSSARAGQKGWFIALLIINTVGILEIVYLYFVHKKKGGESL